MTSVVGLLLAAGAGRRFGGPKALARDDDGTSWLLRAVQALRPCAEIVVVVGAEAELAAALLPMSVARVRAEDWSEGMGASLRAGLRALAPTDHDVALVSLVDLPDVDAGVVARLCASARGPDDLARAAYGGVPGHPVLLGRRHWAGVADTATGDRGARDYLAAREVALVECGDLATGRDVDSRR
ncbi:NTP transferase domain-containing protein [Nocardioides sp. SYSU D00065]|uniref:nucleotidyltransferase family protein n=1 Tax=Nocardioides sp. SYSU D00065 TaxID=2817378 RepID=UPI001B344293|nr:nucleotidyltransferase family protein [Nocardioides sp. SYSU D00065]